MSTFEERLATFTLWPHKLPIPADLAAAGWIHTPTTYHLDLTKCLVCEKTLDSWEPIDDAFVEHVKISPQCSTVISPQKQEEIEARAKEASKPTPVPQDLGFFDSSLQQDFPEIRLFHSVHMFIDHIQRCKYQYREEDIIKILPKCLRGAAFKWCRDLPESSDLRQPGSTLDMWFTAMIKEFEKEAPVQPVKSINSPQPHVLIEYHKCVQCSAQFSSSERLLRHSQSPSCNKATCKCCEKKFDSNNQLHDHIRNRECQATTSDIKSKSASNLAATPLVALESQSSDACTIVKVAFESQSSETVERPPASAGKSKPTPELPATPLASLENTPQSPTITSPLPAYRSVSPPPPTYTKPRNYLTIDDLYMRYAPLKSITSSATRPTSPRVTLPTMTMQDLFEKFQEKTSSNTAGAAANAAKWTKDSPALATANINSIADSKSIAKTSFLAVIKSNTQQPGTPQRRHLKPSKHTALVANMLRNARGHVTSPQGVAVAVGRHTRYRTVRKPWRKLLEPRPNYTHESAMTERKSDSGSAKPRT